MDANELIAHLADNAQDIFGSSFVGFYIHGSMAMGCFNPCYSDIDYFIVVDSEPDDPSRARLINDTISFERYAPRKGLEMHLLLESDLICPVHPVRFLTHYSPTHRENALRDIYGYVSYMRGNDPDLASHITVLRARGYALRGKPVYDVFGPIPRDAYIDSIKEDIFSEYGPTEYRLLNLCRTKAYLESGHILSKSEGAEYILNSDFPYKDVISRALDIYRSDFPLCGLDPSDTEPAIVYLNNIIRELMP